jgi:type I restriction enzyme M protein
MINLCDLKLNETILDPTCGTGGFLSMSIKYLNNKYNNIDWSIYKNNIFGFDIDNHVKNLTLLNLLLETNQLFKDTVCR